MVGNYYELLLFSYILRISYYVQNSRKRKKIVCEYLKHRGGHLLDCATGSGEITRSALSQGDFKKATFVDISTKMLEIAKTQAQQIQNVSMSFVTADIFEYLRDANPVEKWNSVLILGLIAHTGRLAELLSLIRNNLEPNGVVLIQSTLMDHPGTKLVRFLTAKRYVKQKGYAISYFTLQKLEDEIAQAGFKITRMQRFGMGIPFADRIAPKFNAWLEKKNLNRMARKGAEVVIEAAMS